MKKINDIVISSAEPNKEFLWIRPSGDKYEILVFDGGWRSLGSQSTLSFDGGTGIKVIKTESGYTLDVDFDKVATIEDINKKQSSIDINLETENKTIVGAINEINTVINSISTRRYYRQLYEANPEVIFNEDSGYYEVNGIKDITEDEMLAIYTAGREIGEYRGRYIMYYSVDSIRTNLRPFGLRNPVTTTSGFMFYAQNIERALLTNTPTTIAFENQGVLTTGNTQSMFQGCKKLKYVYGRMSIEGITVGNYVANMFYNCQVLEEVRIRHLKVSLSFADSPLLSLDSIQYIIDNNAATNDIYITLHPDAYARAMENEDILASLGAHPLVHLVQPGDENAISVAMEESEEVVIE